MGVKKYEEISKKYTYNYLIKSLFKNILILALCSVCFTRVKYE